MSNNANPQSATRVQILNIIFSLLVLIELLMSPGRRVLFSLIDRPLYANLPDYQQMLGVTLVNYWVPAALMYLVLIFSGTGGQLKTSRPTIRPLIVANSAMIVFIFLNIFSATSLGGIVHFIAPIVVYPAALLISYGLLRLIILNIRIRFSITEISLTDRIAPSISDLSAVAAALVVPVLFVGYAGFAESSPFRAAKTLAPIFEMRCKNAGEKILTQRNDARSIFFAKSSRPLVGGPIKNGFFISSFVGSPSTAVLVDYNVNFVEYEHVTSNPSMGKGKYLRSYGDRIDKVDNKVSVEKPDADYAVYSEEIATERDKSLGIVGQTMTIIDYRTNEIIAMSTYFVHAKQKRFCGHAPDGNFSQSDFIARALNLKPRVQ